MSLERLKPGDLPFTIDTEADPGKPPKLAWIETTMLRVDTRYQRPITKTGLKTIEKIAREFRWTRFSPLILTPSGTGKSYSIIDGQHRATAATVLKLEHVPAMIVSADPQEAARIFAAINGTVTPMSPMAIFKAALAGGDTWAEAVRDACKSAGIEPLVYPIPKNKQKPFQTMALASLRSAYTAHGADVLRAAMEFLASSKGAEEPGFLTSNVIRSYTAMFSGRRAWLGHLDTLKAHIGGINLAMASPADVIERMERILGDGRTAAKGEKRTPSSVKALPAPKSIDQEWDEFKAEVKSRKKRGQSAFIIAQALKAKNADVIRALEDA